MLATHLLRGLSLVGAALLAGCSSWQSVRTTHAWTLYAEPHAPVDIDEFAGVIAPAFDAVEAELGLFERRVHLHAVGQDSDGDAAGTELERVPGIGPARIRAWHVRSGANPFARTGVFLGAADAGTAVHELVHARIADEDVELPLWFEEGLACLLGDGALIDGRWTIDGLCCWPLRELREERLGRGEIERLLALSTQDALSTRDNLLAHFLGWAILFDLAREAPDANWRDWLAAFQGAADPLAEAERRLQRTTADRTHVEWLARLDSDTPAERFATAKGTWKLRSEPVLKLLLDRLEEEDEPEVRLALSINALLTAGEVRISGSSWRRMWRLVFPTLREIVPADPREAEGLELLRHNMRGGRDDRRSQAAFELLARYWEE